MDHVRISKVVILIARSYWLRNFTGNGQVPFAIVHKGNFDPIKSKSHIALYGGWHCTSLKDKKMRG